MKQSVFKKVWEYTKTIPAGKVTTYGIIAKKLSLNPRIVGFALHANKDIDVPCHRVVNRYGQLAKNFAFDGEGEQRRRLQVEGVFFITNNRVDLSKSLFKTL